MNRKVRPIVFASSDVDAALENLRGIFFVFFWMIMNFRTDESPSRVPRLPTTSAQSDYVQGIHWDASAGRDQIINTKVSE